MFGPRTKGAEGETRDTNTTENAPRATAQEQTQSAPRMASPTIARRVVDMPSNSSSRRSPSASSSDSRTLTVGKGLSVAGEITSCDILVVEGKVEAKLSDGKMLEITENGQFRGSVEIENADIAGRYDGNLIVHGRLTVRSTGRISGMVKYGELEVNAGGQIIGEVQVTGGGAQQQQQSQGNSGNFKSAAKFTATSEDDDQPSKTERKSA